MPLTREERFEATMYDLRRVLYDATRYDAKDEQGGVVVDLTPALTLHVECFAQLNRWRGRLMSEDAVLEEWLTVPFGASSRTRESDFTGRSRSLCRLTSWWKTASMSSGGSIQASQRARRNFVLRS